MEENNVTYERISDNPIYDGYPRMRHEYRYKLASKFTRSTDVVLDSACGTGYAKRILKGKYIGVDKFPGHIVADLNNWVPDFEYDVFVCFETIEHIEDYTQLVINAKNAKSIIAVSAPIVPTVQRDWRGEIVPDTFHVHDFTLDQLKEIFIDKDWELIHEEIQGENVGILILRRNG